VVHNHDTNESPLYVFKPKDREDLISEGVPISEDENPLAGHSQAMLASDV
jgi:hypothetical protein